MNRTNSAASSPGQKDWRLICDLLDVSARSYSDRILFKDRSGRTVTYAEAKEQVDNLARGLVLEGFAADDKIGLLGEHNCSEWCISYLAIMRLGAVVVPLDPSLKEGELATLLGDCEASGIISSGKTIEMLKKIRNDVPSLERIAALDRTGSSGVPLIGDLIGKGRGQKIRFPDVDPDSLAILLYTSGTTGKPKGVMLSHANIISDIRAVHKRLPFDPDDVVLSILPLHHTLECTCGFLNSMSLGCKVVFARSYKSSELVEDIRDNGVSYMCGVPLLYEKMYLSFKRKIAKNSAFKRGLFGALFSISSYGQKRHWNWGRGLLRSMREKAGMGSLRMLVSGGAALPIDIGRFFSAIGIPMLQGYGLSETSPVLSVNPVELNKFDSIGPPLDGVELRIDNPDQHGIGEIVVSGPMVMLGYYKNDAATAAVLRRGWFFTGDIGCVDPDGYMYITGRSKNVIVSAAGKNIYPEEIEALLNESPYILESLVLGRKAPNSNIEDVTAVIVSDPDAMTETEQRSVDEIIQAEVTSVCSRLADFKRIKKYYIRNEELPKTSTGKIKRCLAIDDGGNLFERKRI
jgi:long-chain acyl-CoA synthetase